MSVRMALAKLCACACGGAMIGGGAIHATQSKAGSAGYQYSKAQYSKAKPVKKIVRKRIAYAAPKKRVVKRIRRTVTTTTTTLSCPPGSVQVGNRAGSGAPYQLQCAQQTVSVQTRPAPFRDDGFRGGGGGAKAAGIQRGYSAQNL